MEFLLERVRRVVVKLGTGILTSGIGKLDTDRIGAIAADVAALRARGLEVLLVSSGAVGLGMGRLGLKQRPRRFAAAQKCAAVGQSILIDHWQRAFDPHGLTVAQVLLTREDVKSRERHLAVNDLLEELLHNNLVPILNENDSVSTTEIRFGDNDVLSALVASLSKAELLVILSTAPGLIDREGTGEIIPVVESITPAVEALAGGTTDTTATGGMVTKVEAARIANRSGCGAIIASGKEPGILQRLLRGEASGTFFVPSKLPVQGRKRWIAFFQPAAGEIHVDPGAEAALREHGSSLLAKGITGCTGQFGREAVVTIARSGTPPFARGISRFSADELRAIAGMKTADIQARFPRLRRHEAVHRDSLVMLG